MQLLSRLGVRLTAVSVAIVVVAALLVGVVVAKLSEQEVQDRLIFQANSAAEQLAEKFSAEELSPSNLNAEILRKKISNAGSIWIIDKNGSLIADIDPDNSENTNVGSLLIELTTVVLPQMTDKKGIERKMSLKEAANQYEAGFGVLEDVVQSEKKVFAFKSVPSKGWIVGVDEPAESNKSAAESLKKYILLTCFVLGGAILLSTALSMSFIIKPYYREKLELSERIEKANRNLKKLHDVSVGMQRSLALDERIKKILGAAHEVLGLDRIFIFLPDEKNEMLECKGAFGNQDEPIEKIKLPVENGGVIAKSFVYKKIHRVMNVRELPPDLKLQPPYSEIRALQSRSYVSLPLVVENKCLGVVVVDNQLTKKSIGDETIEDLELFTGQAAVAVENAQLYKRLQSHADDLEVTDHLTKLYTFAHFKELIQGQIDGIASGSTSKISLGIFSVKDFAEYNKQAGPALADNLLLTLAEKIREQSGDQQIVGRCFGSTMAVLFVNQDISSARRACLEINDKLNSKKFPIEEKMSSGCISFLIRCGEYLPDKKWSADRFFSEVCETEVLKG